MTSQADFDLVAQAFYLRLDKRISFEQLKKTKQKYLGDEN